MHTFQREVSISHKMAHQAHWLDNRSPGRTASPKGGRVIHENVIRSQSHMKIACTTCKKKTGPVGIRATSSKLKGFDKGSSDVVRR